MAGGESPGASTAKRRKQNKQRSSSSVQAPKPELVRLESLPWRSVSEQDTFDFLDGSSEGGFLSLEEIDESEYGIIGGDVVEAFAPSKKRCKQVGKDGTGLTVPGGKENKTNKQKKNKKKKKEKQKKKTDVPVNVEEVASVDVISKDRNDAEEGLDDQLAVDKSEYNAWKELRLHPLLMKSIYRLGFKEPTPIQKSCIPAAAHQGKDVIGAAETGSGKTLAFGLPILQRLLEEQEKASRFVKEEKMVEEVNQGGPLRALVVIPTRELALQVTDHLKEAAKFTNIKVVPIVGGMSSEKQERLLKKRPEIVVGTPGRLWELISGREQHLVELHWLSFFVLDEADRMIENGHFHELQSIIDMLPTDSSCTVSQVSGNCKTVPNLKLKKRQTCVFSATIALSENFRKKLKHKASNPKSSAVNELNSIEILSQRAGIRDNVAIFDLTKASIVAEKLEESFIECTEENKEAYLYYLLSVHGHGRTIVFCTSIAALRRIASLLHILGINAWTLHAQMQQRARLKAIDRFRGNEHAILVATDVAARGLDIPGVRTVVHFQLPHSADVYIHRSGRTARASSDGCCIALISPSDRGKFFSLCKSLSKENLLRFPLNEAYLPDILKRVSLARQIDKMMRMNSQESVKKSWFERNAKAMELMIDQSDSEEEAARIHKQKKMGSLRMQNLQQELKLHLSKPLQSKQFSHRFLAGAGVSHVMQQQLEELSKQKRGVSLVNEKKPRLVVIGQDCVEPLQALRTSGHEVCLNNEKRIETRNLANQWKRKRKEDKKRESEQRRKKKKQG